MSSTTVAQHTTQPLNFGPEWFVHFVLKIDAINVYRCFFLGFGLYQHRTQRQQHQFHHQVPAQVAMYLGFRQQNIVIPKNRFWRYVQM